MSPRLVFPTAVLALSLWSQNALAADKLLVAVGQPQNWDSSVALLGQRTGIFKQHNLELEIVPTSGTGETVQAVLAGSDIGVGAGTLGVIRAFSKGAPIRIIGAGFTGGSDLYWYVRSDSPIKSIGDVTHNHTIGYSTGGASTQYVVLSFAKYLGLKARPKPSGSPIPTLTQVMQGHLDIGWATPPHGLEELEAGKIRVLLKASDLPTVSKQTVRVLIGNATTLMQRSEVVARFLTAYETIDWMYSDPKAVTLYAESVGKPTMLVRSSLDHFFPREAMSLDQPIDLTALMSEAINLQIVDQTIPADQLHALMWTGSLH